MHEKAVPADRRNAAFRRGAYSVGTERLPVPARCDNQRRFHLPGRNDACSGEKSPGRCVFYGEGTLVFAADIPEGARNIAVRYDDNFLTSSLTADGEEIGRKAFAPYVYDVPGKFAGKRIEFCLTLRSSTAPLFGKLSDPGIVWGMRISDPEIFGVGNLSIMWD